MKKNNASLLLYGSMLAVGLSAIMSGCFKDLPIKTIVYQNDFESKKDSVIDVYNSNGLVDTVTITDFNGNKVFGRFNNNFLYMKLKNLPPHNILKIEFDLYIHDQWNGDYIAPGNSLPDAWVLNLDNSPLYLTTFSNGAYRQSFPDNYVAGGFKNPPKADAWETNLPGACSLQSNNQGTSMYKIVKTTGHSSDSLVITMNDVLQPPGNFCLKSWSIDNLTITASKYGQ